MIKEGKVKLDVQTPKTVSKKMDVFFNPIMKFNRDMTILLVDSYFDHESRIDVCLPLAGSGVRGIRMIKESKVNISSLALNDHSKDAIKIIKKNIRLNEIDKNNYAVTNKDACLLLIESTGFDYIDIDPFGSPNVFLECAIKRVKNNGILAVTATDTAPLCGTYVNTCRRKYWAEPHHGYQMHETGLRILIRKVQLVGGQADKALIPIFSYSKDHYFRIFFKVLRGKSKVDELIKKHKMMLRSGPMWLGELFDKRLVALMKQNNQDKTNEKILDTIYKESRYNLPGFIHINKFAKKFKLKRVPKKEYLMNLIKEKGYKVTPTHFSDLGIKTNMKESTLIGLKELKRFI
jgi:tRNA (guanine26-N2/guanine27-N2)-dimethyltransferase